MLLYLADDFVERIVGFEQIVADAVCQGLVNDIEIVHVGGDDNFGFSTPVIAT